MVGLNLLMIRIVVRSRLEQPRREKDVRTAGCRATLCAGALRASPEVFSCNAAARAAWVIKGAHVCHAHFPPAQIVQMNVDRGRCVDRNVNILVCNDIAGDDGSVDWGTAASAVDIDPYTSWRRGVAAIRKVAGDVVVGDHVPFHVVGGESEIRSYMGMQCDTADSIANEPVVGDHVLRGTALADPITKDANSSASYLHTIVLDVVAVNRNVKDAIMLRPDCTHGRMRRKLSRAA